jgi:hypothetical protein
MIAACENFRLPYREPKHHNQIDPHPNVRKNLDTTFGCVFFAAIILIGLGVLGWLSVTIRQTISEVRNSGRTTK